MVKATLAMGWSTNNRVLWALFIATLVCSGAFPVVASYTGLTFLDGLSDPSAIRELLAAMSLDERRMHAVVTATLDVVYPMAYGGLFMGSALKFHGQVGRYLVLLMLLLIAVDLSEGVVQVLALLDIIDVLGWKALLTPLKFALFALGLVATVLGWLRWLLRRWKKA